MTGSVTDGTSSGRGTALDVAPGRLDAGCPDAPHDVPSRAVREHAADTV